MIAFHKILPEDMEAKEIILKCKFKEAWMGLVMAEESGEVWRSILSTDSTPEIGVFMITRPGELSDDFAPSEPRPQMSICASTGKTTNVGTSYAKITAPATYKVCPR